MENTEIDVINNSSAGAISGSGGNIDNCYNTGYVFGGIAGGLSGDSDTVSNSYNEGNIFAGNEVNCFAGGIVGQGRFVKNCFNIGNVSTKNGSAGGIIGLASNSNISGCYNMGNIVSEAEAGGICGWAFSGNDTILNCYNAGDIIGDSFAGGICADVWGIGRNSTIRNCYNRGNVSGKEAGGISGYNGIIAACANVGNISGTWAGGINSREGLVSDCYNWGEISASMPADFSVDYIAAGGIIARISSEAKTPINNCYNTGVVSAVSADSPAYVGGICGRKYNYDTICKNCYWNSDSDQIINGLLLSEKRGVGNGIDDTFPLSSSEMKQEAAFIGFDFNAVWDFIADENNDYPILRVFYPVSVVFSTMDSNGTLTAEVDGIKIQSGTPVQQCKEIHFTAIPKNGYRVKHWVDNGNIIEDHQSVYSILCLTEAHTITVEFELISYTILPDAKVAVPGKTVQFIAQNNDGTISREVSWSVTGGIPGTSIDETGLLTVAVDETAESLTVTATSLMNPAITSSIELPVNAATGDVKVVAESDFLVTGKSVQFTVLPIVDVIWSVSGCAPDTTIDANGLLTVAPGETAENITVYTSCGGSLTLPLYKLGDLNRDKSVDVQDIMAACRILARKAADIQPEASELLVGDITGEGNMGIDDIMGICRIVANQT